MRDDPNAIGADEFFSICDGAVARQGDLGAFDGDGQEPEPVRMSGAAPPVRQDSGMVHVHGDSDAMPSNVQGGFRFLILYTLTWRPGRFLAVPGPGRFFYRKKYTMKHYAVTVRLDDDDNRRLARVREAYDDRTRALVGDVLHRRITDAEALLIAMRAQAEEVDNQGQEG